MEEKNKVTEKTAAYANALIEKLASVSSGLLKKKAYNEGEYNPTDLIGGGHATEDLNGIEEEERNDEGLIKDIKEHRGESDKEVENDMEIAMSGYADDEYGVAANEAKSKCIDACDDFSLDFDGALTAFNDLCRIYKDADADPDCAPGYVAEIEESVTEAYKKCTEAFPDKKDSFELPEGIYVTSSKKTRLIRIASRRARLAKKASDSMYVEEAHAPKEEKNMEEELKEDKKENPFGGSDKKEDKKEEKSEDKKEDKKEEKSDKPEDKSLDKSQKDALEGAFDAMKTCGDPACKEAMDTLKSAFPFLGKEDKKEDKLGGDLGSDIPGIGEDLPELGDAKDAEPAGDLGGPADIKPFAGLVATLKKQASVGDSVWVITDPKTNEEFASFNIKAAFGEHINTDKARAAYATSQKFGRDVIASLVANKAHDVMSATAAVLQVAAHYSPEWAGAKAYKDNPESSHAKASGEGDVTTDKNLISEGKEAKAAAKASLTKKASEYNVPGVTDNGEIPADSLLLDGADKRSEKVSNNTEESAHAKNSTKVEEETDRKLVASYEAQIKRQASENAALAKQIETLKTEAAIKEKSAKVKECVALMCNKGFIKADENVRVASLKEGLSIEAANGRAMAASIDKQAKYLFGMNSTQLDAYMNSLKGVSTPAFTSTASAGQSALTIKASATSENETDRLLKLFGWD